MSDRHRSRMFFGALLVLLVLSASAGGAAGVPAGQAAEPTRVTIATLKVEPAALAHYAKERGFFAKQGIDATILPLSSPTQLVPAVLSGQAQITGLNIGGAALVKTRNAPLGVVAAGAIYRREESTTALVSARGKRITRARDLIGKTIAIDSATTIAHVGLLKWLKGNGVSQDDVKLVEMPFASMIGPLQQGTIDAAVVPEPYLTIALQNGSRRVAHILHAVCPRTCLLTVWLARTGTDRNLVARFRNAIQAAAVWANERRNDPASRAILAKYEFADKTVLTKMTRTRFAPRLRVALAQPWINAYIEFGLIPPSFRAIDLVK